MCQMFQAYTMKTCQPLCMCTYSAPLHTHTHRGYSAWTSADTFSLETRPVRTVNCRHVDANTYITFTFSWKPWHRDTHAKNVPRACLPPSPRRSVSPGGTSKVTYVWVCAWEQKGRCIKEENREFIFVISGAFICTAASPFWKRDALR